MPLPEKSDRPSWPLVEGRAVAEEIVSLLSPYCERITIAGSIRRQKPRVRDIEILYIPKEKRVLDCRELFRDPMLVEWTEEKLFDLEKTGVLQARKNKLGRKTLGDSIKLYVHVRSGIPVDLFATNSDSWWNYLVCRTGPAESNIRIASAAKRKGGHWRPYTAGFELDGGIVPIRSEKEVFDFVGLPYLPPEQRT